MAGEETAEVIVTADTKPYEAAMAKTPAAATGAAKAISSSFAGEFSKVGQGAAALASGLGGPFGQIAGLSQSALKPLAEVSTGLAGVAAGGAAVVAGGALLVGALYSTGKAAFALADGAVEAAERLDRLGVSVGSAERMQLDGYSDATTDLGIAMDELSVAVGSDLAGDLTTIVSAAAGGVRTFIEVREAASGFAEVSRGVLRVALSGASYGFSELAIAATQYAAETNKAVEATTRITTTVLDAEAAQRKMLETLGLLVPVEEEERLAREAAAKARAAETKAAQDAAAVNAGLAAARQEEIAQLTREINELAEAAKAQAQAVQAEWDLSSTFADLTVNAAAATDAIEQMQQQSTASWRQGAINAARDITMVSLDGIQDVTSTYLQSVADRVAAGESLTAAERRAANTAMDAAEIAAIGQAAIQATLSGMGMITYLAPYMGPLAIPVGTTIAAGMFAASVYAIESGQPFRYSYRPGGGNGRGDPDSAGSLAGVDEQLGEESIKDDDPSDRAGEIRHGGARGSGSTARGGGGGVMVTVDPRLDRLRIVSDRRIGKR